MAGSNRVKKQNVVFFKGWHQKFGEIRYDQLWQNMLAPPDNQFIIE